MMKKLFTSVTRTLSPVLKTWSDNQAQGYFTGVMLYACEVFSICDGVIVQIEKSHSNRSVVTVQYSSNLYVRYLNISSDSLTSTEGKTIEEGQLIGEAYNNKLIFEVCSTSGNKLWPVRIGKYTFYKTDPMPYLVDSASVFKQHNIYIEPTYSENDVVYNEEFDGMNRGEW